ncbi:MAG: hypothetical protein JWM39_628 [Parcubacteria group bacterium]|nr:hypothetical protein [Parcubacteria group bacterium]
MHKILLLILVALVLCGMGYEYVVSHQAFPPKSNVCFEMLTSSLEVAKSNPAIRVPNFSLDSIRYIRCAAIPGITNFTIAGIDSFGKEFRIYETVGGRAASGGDSILDYCYTQDGKIISQIRITGHEGKHSNSACIYDESLLAHPVTYEYGLTK